LGYQNTNCFGSHLFILLLYTFIQPQAQSLLLPGIIVDYFLCNVFPD